MIIRHLAAVLLSMALPLTATPALADATIPTADVKSAQDNPLLKRYEGSLIIILTSTRHSTS